MFYSLILCLLCCWCIALKYLQTRLRPLLTTTDVSTQQITELCGLETGAGACLLQWPAPTQSSGRGHDDVDWQSHGTWGTRFCNSQLQCFKLCRYFCNWVMSKQDSSVLMKVCCQIVENVLTLYFKLRKNPSKYTNVQLVLLMKNSPVLFQSMSDVNTQQVDQFREFSKIYNTMSEICFNQCVWDFGTEEVRTRKEVGKI